MTEFKGLQYQQFASFKETTAEERYWNQYKKQVLLRQHAKITDINFCPVAPYDYAVSTSTRVLIIDSATQAIKKTVSRFKDIAYSGSFRADGKLLVAGSEDKRIKVFDMATRSVLRQFIGHSDAVHVSRFSRNNTTVFSCSDDRTARLWDMPTQLETTRFEGHTDYVRCGLEVPDGTAMGGSGNLWLTGAYDHTVRLWDSRVAGASAAASSSSPAGSAPSSGRCVMTLDQGCPVQSLVCLSSGGLAMSAGENLIKVWDIVAGGKRVHTFSGHQKTVTSLALEANNSRLLSGSLDHQVKVYDLSTYKVTYSFKMPQPVLSLGLAPDSSQLAIGMVDGSLAIRVREVKTAPLEPETKAEPAPGSKRYYQRGASFEPQDLVVVNTPIGASAVSSGSGVGAIANITADTFGTGADVGVVVEKRKKLAAWDQLLKKFRYREALDCALRERDTSVPCAMFEELIHRGGLQRALAGRDDQSLEPLMRFLIRTITNPRYSDLLVDVTHVLLDTYSRAVGQSALVDELFHTLSTKLDSEQQVQLQLVSLSGALDLLAAVSSSFSAAAAAAGSADAFSESEHSDGNTTLPSSPLLQPLQAPPSAMLGDISPPPIGSAAARNSAGNNAHVNGSMSPLDKLALGAAASDLSITPVRRKKSKQQQQQSAEQSGSPLLSSASQSDNAELASASGLDRRKPSSASSSSSSSSSANNAVTPAKSKKAAPSAPSTPSTPASTGNHSGKHKAAATPASDSASAPAAQKSAKKPRVAAEADGANGSAGKTPKKRASVAE